MCTPHTCAYERKIKTLYKIKHYAAIHNQCKGKKKMIYLQLTNPKNNNKKVILSLMDRDDQRLSLRVTDNSIFTSQYFKINANDTVVNKKLLIFYKEK